MCFLENLGSEMIDLQDLQTDLNRKRDVAGSLKKISNQISDGRVGNGGSPVKKFKRRLFVEDSPTSTLSLWMLTLNKQTLLMSANYTWVTMKQINFRKTTQ
jgi:hypothetical protein